MQTRITPMKDWLSWMKPVPSTPFPCKFSLVAVEKKVTVSASQHPVLLLLSLVSLFFNGHVRNLLAFLLNDWMFSTNLLLISIGKGFPIAFSSFLLLTA
jgi:hypothetical protein